MHFAKRYKIILIIIISLFLLSQLYVGLGEMLYGVYGKPLRALKDCFLVYLQEHEGVFPPSEDVLSDNGYIEITGRQEKISLLVSRHLPVNKEQEGASEEWEPCHSFREFHIRYGVNKRDLAEREGRLYDKDGKEVLLIDGPYRWFLPYEKVSLELFHTMK